MSENTTQQKAIYPPASPYGSQSPWMYYSRGPAVTQPMPISGGVAGGGLASPYQHLDMKSLMGQMSAMQDQRLQAAQGMQNAALAPQSNIVRKDISGNVITGNQPRGLDAYYANNPHMKQSSQRMNPNFNKNKDMHPHLRGDNRPLQVAKQDVQRQYGLAAYK